MSWDLNANGHICIYGGTSTGKTVFMKYLIDKYINAGKYNDDEIYIFSTSTYQWDGYKNVCTEWGDLKEVKNKVLKSTNKRGLVVLDDFNDIIDTVHDKRYIELFTRGRHIGIRVMTVAHKPTSIGKDARESLLYAITGFSSNIDYINELSKYFYGNQNNKLQQLLREGNRKGPYTMLIINKRTEQTFTDKAPYSVDSINTDTQNTPYDSNNYSDTPNSINAGVQNTKNCVYDQSKNMTNYNINNKIEINQMFQRNEANNRLKEINYQHNKKMRLLREKEECYSLCLKTIKKEEDIMRQIDLLNQFCQVSCVNRFNLENYSTSFMNHYYPEVNYRESTIKKIGNNYGLIKSINDQDYVPLAATGISYLSNNSLLKSLTNLF